MLGIIFLGLFFFFGILGFLGFLGGLGGLGGFGFFVGLGVGFFCCRGLIFCLWILVWYFCFVLWLSVMIVLILWVCLGFFWLVYVFFNILFVLIYFCLSFWNFLMFFLRIGLNCFIVKMLYSWVWIFFFVLGFSLRSFLVLVIEILVCVIWMCLVMLL